MRSAPKESWGKLQYSEAISKLQLLKIFKFYSHFQRNLFFLNVTGAEEKAVLMSFMKKPK